MNSYAARISSAKLAIAGLVAFLLSVALIFGGVGLFAAYSTPVVMFSSIVGRALFIAGIVLVVLAVVRKLERR